MPNLKTLILKKIPVFIIFSVFFTLTAQISNAQVVTYNPPIGVDTNDYTITVNGQNVNVKKWNDVYIARLALNGSATFNITYKETINEFRVSPKSYDISATANGRLLNFTVDGPQHLVVDINNPLVRNYWNASGRNSLYLLIDPLETNIPNINASNVINVMDYGANNSGGDAAGTTDAIERAASNVPSGGTLYFPAGTYRTQGATIDKANITVYLAPDAYVYRTGHIALQFNNNDNVTIRGRGYIEGAGHSVSLRFFDNLLIEDTFFINTSPSGGALVTYHVGNGTMRNVKVLTNKSGPTKYRDGIQIHNGSNWLIENSFISSADDSIVLKASDYQGVPEPMDNFTIRNNVIWTQVRNMIGTESYENVTNVTWEGNHTLYGTQSFFSRDSGTDYLNMVVKDARYENTAETFFKVGSTFGGNISGFTGTLDVRVENMVVDVIWPNDSAYQGLLVSGASGSDVNVDFINLCVAGQPIGSLADLRSLGLNNMVVENSDVTFALDANVNCDPVILPPSGGGGGVVIPPSPSPQPGPGEDPAGPVVGSVTLEPSADTFSDSSHPSGMRINSELGNWQSVAAQSIINDRTAYFKFDLSTLQGLAINKATFRYRIVDSTWAGSIFSHSFHEVSDTSWTETGDTRVSYSNSPEFSDATLAEVGAVSRNEVVEVDLTSFIANNAGEVVAFAVDNSSIDWLSIYSRTSDSPPELVVDYSSVPLETITGDNILRNPSFEETSVPPINEWRLALTDSNAGTAGQAQLISNTSEVNHLSKSAQIDITEPSGIIQLFQRNVPLEANSTYVLSFDAYSSTGDDVQVQLLQDTAPFIGYGLPRTTIPLTSGWQTHTLTFNTNNLGGFDNVTDGRFRFWFTGQASAGASYYIDNTVLAKVVSVPDGSSEPPSGHVLPTRIEAEDYNEGESNEAYFDTTSGNEGGVYRTDDVDVQVTTDIVGAYNVGWVRPGEWLAYDVYSPSTSTYNLTMRISGWGFGNRDVGLVLNGNRISTLSFTNSGTYRSWKDVNFQNIVIPQGSHELRLEFDDGYHNINYMDFELVGNNPNPTSTPTPSSTISPTNGAMPPTVGTDTDILPENPPACTRYVSRSGNNSNNGTSLGNAWGSITYAINNTGSGDVICVADGTYFERININNKSNLTIRALDDQEPRPTLDGDNYRLPERNTLFCSRTASNNNGGTCPPANGTSSWIRGWQGTIDVQYSNDINVYGFEVTRTNARGARTLYSDNVRLYGLDINNNRNSGIQFHQTTNTVLESSLIWENANYARYHRSASELNWPVIVLTVSNDLNNYTDNVTIKNNKIFRNWGEGVGAGRNSTNTIIENNEIFDNYAMQVYVHRTQGSKINNNLIYHTGDSTYFRGNVEPTCIAFNNEYNFTNAIFTEDNLVTNNLLAGCGKAIAFWRGGGGQDIAVRDARIYNNTIVDTTQETIQLIGENHRDIEFKNNIIYEDTEPVITSSVGGRPYFNFENNLWNRDPGVQISNSSPLVADPVLLSPNAAVSALSVNYDKFRLGSGSPAIEAGESLNEVPFDFFGVERPDAPDIGAIQFDGSVAQPTPSITSTPTPIPTPTGTPTPIITSTPNPTPSGTPTPIVTGTPTPIPTPTFTPTPTPEPTATPDFRLEAEDYDEGGQRVSYFDTTTGNSGGAYRNDDVDIENTFDEEGTYNVTDIRSTEWLTYTINGVQAGTYDMNFRLAGAGFGLGSINVYVNDVFTGNLGFTNTFGDQNWETYTLRNITLPAGTVRVQLEFALGNFNLNYVDFVNITTNPNAVLNARTGFEVFEYSFEQADPTFNSYTKTKEKSKTGAQSAKLVSTSNTRQSKTTPPNAITVVPNKTYYGEVFVNNPNFDGYVELKLNFWDEELNYITGSGSRLSSSSTNWQVVPVTAQSPANAKFVSVEVVTRGNGQVYLDDMTLGFN